MDYCIHGNTTTINIDVPPNKKELVLSNTLKS